MRNMLLSSVAAIALIAGTGFANAQAIDKGAAPAAGGEMRGGADVKGNADVKGARPGVAADEKMAPKGKAQQAQTPAKTDGNRAEQNGRGKETTGQASPETRSRSESSKSESKPEDGKAQNTTNSDSKATTGQGASGSRGAANLTSEQRTKITTVIKQRNVRPVTNVNFPISVGARVPRTVEFYPLPVEVVEVYPSWRGYEFILVGDEIVVINPRTLEIVAVLEA